MKSQKNTISLRNSFSHVRNDAAILPSKDGTVQMFMKTMNLNTLYAQSKSSEIQNVLKQQLKPFHALKVLICTAANKKNETLLLGVLTPYINAIQCANSMCTFQMSDKCSKEDTAGVEHFTGFTSMYPSLGQILRWIVDAEFLDVIPVLERLKLFDQGIHHCPGTTGEKPLHRYQNFGTTNGSLLSHFIIDVQDRWSRHDFAVLKKLIKAGARMSTGALCYALFVSNAATVVRLFANYDFDFGARSSRNGLPVPDCLLTAVLCRPSAIPFLLRYGGIKLNISEGSYHQDTDGTKIYTCCALRRWTIIAMRQFAAVFFICPRCRVKHNLTNEPLSMMAAVRLQLLSTLKPHELLDEETVAPIGTFPEPLRKFILCKPNDRDEKEFLDVMDVILAS